VGSSERQSKANDPNRRSVRCKRWLGGATGTANMECCSRGKRILVRTRAVDRWHRYLQLPEVHYQLSSVMVPVVEDQRPHQSDTRSRKDLPLSLSGSPYRCGCLVSSRLSHSAAAAALASNAGMRSAAEDNTGA